MPSGCRAKRGSRELVYNFDSSMLTLFLFRITVWRRDSSCSFVQPNPTGKRTNTPRSKRPWPLQALAWCVGGVNHPFGTKSGGLLRQKQNNKHTKVSLENRGGCCFCYMMHSTLIKEKNNANHKIASKGNKKMHIPFLNIFSWNQFHEKKIT